MNTEEKDQAEKRSSRSRSPFMWWVSTMQDRSQSGPSRMSSYSHMEEAQSQYYQKPEPAFFHRHTHKESAASDYSLPSIINGRELAEDARVNPLAAGRGPTSPYSSRNINFSRAFSPRHQSTLTSTSASKVLSQIVESSPRDSCASKSPSISKSPSVSNSPSVSKSPGVISKRELIGGDVSAPVPQASPALPSPHPAHSVPDSLRRSSGLNMVSRFSSTTDISPSLSTVDLSRAPPVPQSSHLPASPRSTPPPRVRRYLEESVPSPHTVASMSPKQPSSEISETDQQQIDSTQDTSSMAYWGSRPDLQPVRKLSKKGNVLRKKSIRRAEIVSWVGN
jgi:hypothetical protein